MPTLPSKEELRHWFDYDEGKLIWKVSPTANVFVGQIAGATTRSGVGEPPYITIGLSRKLYRAHRLVYHGEFARDE